MPLYPTLVVLSSNNKKNWKFVLMQYLLWCSPSLLSNLLVFMWHVFSVLNFAQHSSPILLQKIWYMFGSVLKFFVHDHRRAYQLLEYQMVQWMCERNQSESAHFAQVSSSKPSCGINGPWRICSRLLCSKCCFVGTQRHTGKRYF